MNLYSSKINWTAVSVLLSVSVVIIALVIYNLRTESKEMNLYIGTYTTGESKGIYHYTMNSETGQLKLVDVTDNILNPSYLAIEPKGNYLFAVSEVNDFDSAGSGSIKAFKIDPATKALTKLNTVSTGGAHPCYVSADNEGKHVLTANYSGGNVSAIPINNDGRLSEDVSIAQHSGSSIVEKRQDKPYAHCVTFDPLNKFVFAVDLGIDKVMIYKLEDDQLIPNEPAFAQLTPGAGPRHMVFHPGQNFAYVITELSNKIYAFKHNAETGALSEIGNYSSLPNDFEGTSYCADIHIHPNGKFLYGSNRGHNSIVIFSINQNTGELDLIGHESVHGDWPRNFVIDPTGKFLLVANQKSNDVVVFKINSNSGSLEFTGINENIPSPVCIKFLKL